MTARTAQSASLDAGPHSWPMRLWLAAPDWFFRALGVAFFCTYLAMNLQKYDQNFWELGPYYKFADGRSIHMPWVPVLIDLTYLMIILGFCTRLPARSRAANGWVVSFSLFTAFLPLFPIWASPLIGLWNTEWQAAYNNFMWRSSVSLSAVVIGGSLITVGNFLDVWSYFTLRRSFGIVPESRELITKGPYRLVRHPVYLGQFLAQGGVWLFFAQAHVVWIGFYLLFVTMQLYRSKLEDRVLASAFGDQYRQWRQQTFWFV